MVLIPPVRTLRRPPFVSLGQVSGAATAVARHDGSSSAPDSTSEEESFGPEEERNVGKGGGGRRNSSFGTRMLGDVEEDGFTGTRMGYQVLKVRAVGWRVVSKTKLPFVRTTMSMCPR